MPPSPVTGYPTPLDDDAFGTDLPSCVSLSWPGDPGLAEILSSSTGGLQADADAPPPGTGPVLPFGQLAAQIAEDMTPGPAMAGWLAAASPGGQDDYALAGLAAGWRRLAAWATSQELATVAEMTARAAARDSSVPAGPDGRPAQMPEDATAEVALALRMSRFGAEIWADLAVTLSWRLPGTMAALTSGAIDLSRARLIAEATGVLDDAGAQAVEDKVLAKAGQQTLGQLRAVLRRAVLTVDPKAAERRRQDAQRHARVGLYSDEEGTATLAGHNLPAAHAVAAMARITALAQAMKAAGAGGGIDLLRAQVLVGLLLNTLPFIPPPEEDPGAPGPPEPDDNGPPEGPPDGSDPPHSGPPPKSGPPPGTGPPPHSGPPPKSGPPPHSGPAPGTGSGPYTGPAPDTGPPPDTQPDCVPWPGGDVGAVKPPCGHSTGGRTTAQTLRPVSPWPGLPMPGSVLASGFPLGLAGSSGFPPGTVRSSGSPPGPAGATRSPPRPTGRVTLTVPWRTLAGISPEPGSVCWLGPVTPAVAREIAMAGAIDPATQWRVIVTDDSGQFICVARIRRQGPAKPGPRPDGSTPAGSGPAISRPAMRAGLDPAGAVHGLVNRVTLTVPQSLLNGAGQAALAALAGQPGTRNLTALLGAAIATTRKAVDHPAPTGGTPSCPHEDSAGRYRPSTRLREAVVARDQTCRFAVCRQPAWHADLDHTVPHHLGGATCACNLGPECRAHHRLKQRPGWSLSQPAPGQFEWLTPSGRRYVVTPDPYPI